MHVSTSQFFGDQGGSIPIELELRAEGFTLTLIAILSISFFLLAFSRLSNNKTFRTVFSAFFTFGSIDQLLKENMRLGSIGSVVLILNYFVSSYLCFFLIAFRMLSIDFYWAVILSILLPFSLFIIENVGLFMVSWVTGEYKNMEATIQNTLIGFEFSGIAYSLLSLVWIMNPEFNQLFLGLFIALFGLKYIHRFLKNSVTVLTNGIPWYYLILYFCTLEILPLFVALYYVKQNFLNVI